jgi:hypothetical protein
MHADLRLAGTLPPLDAPHHMRATEWATYREGVVLSSVPGEGSLLNVGLDKVSHLPHELCMKALQMRCSVFLLCSCFTCQHIGAGSADKQNSHHCHLLNPCVVYTTNSMCI